MRFYDGQHRHYCGVDLHTKRMYLCILDREGNKLLHRNVRAKPHDFLVAIEGFRDDLIVGAECMFTWYWLADLCLEEKINFVLGHALYMKAIHGGKEGRQARQREDCQADAWRYVPASYVYPREMRATRDLVRRRMFLVRRRAELLAHVQLLNQQYNQDPFEKMRKYAANRDVLGRFAETSAQLNVAADLQMVGHYDQAHQATGEELTSGS